MRTRSRLPFALAAALGLLAALAFGGAALAAETTLTATLAGTEETDPGDADGTGSATIRIDPAAGSACWNLAGTNIMPVTQSHIHTGAAGVAGPVLVPLDVDGFEGTSEGCATGQDAAALQGIIDNPAGFYVNLHTADYPAGAVRGQLAAAQPNTALPFSTPAPLAIVGLVMVLAAGAIALRMAIRPAMAD